ncbi:MAG: TetR/AcrR family transcriptional regulator [Polyangiaceae bacterium]|nr:TetR/AcrR family transcriptional regulator [Polyangiaceae bacterium]MCB9608710.1 TetR/AcrR family transcriptional regulator [Polyangiaceae bacterium]
MRKLKKRAYSSPLREEGRAQTQRQILDATRDLLGKQSLEQATIADIAEAAGVGTSTVYAAFKSKDGIVRQLFEEALFGPKFKAAFARLETASDPIDAVAATAQVARSIYDGERAALGDLRAHAAGSAALHELDQRFEELRFEMQRARVERLAKAGLLRPPLKRLEARRIAWMYTGRPVYTMLAVESGWGSKRYAQWLEQTLLEALVCPQALAEWREKR